MWDAITRHIVAATGTAYHKARPTPLHGGSISRAYRLEVGKARYFVKINDARHAAMFVGEAASLTALAQTRTVRVPTPLCWGIAQESCYLVLEYVELLTPQRSTAQRLGEQLAALHSQTAPYYGWHTDNTIGTAAQINTPQDSWSTFWRDCRLRPQLALAAQRGHTGRLQRLGEALCAALPERLRDHAPPAALLHGDLWSGNWAMDEHGAPILFDPAVYYGDRETDLAMTRLFGGFDPAFYDSYMACAPLPSGHAERVPLYNLYHILNHANLFGGGYATQAIALMEKLV